jgi:hypothetical protein
MFDRGVLSKIFDVENFHHQAGFGLAGL